MVKQTLKSRAVFEEVIPKILEEQAKGTTARSLCGAPTHWALSFTVRGNTKRASKENDDPKLMIMDSALLSPVSLHWLALSTFFSTDQAIGYGLITLLLVGLVGGLAFYLMYYFVYQYYGPDTDRSQRPPFWKSIPSNFGLYGPLVGCLLCNKLPTSKPQSSPCSIALWLSLGATLLALHFYLKKRFNIRSASGLSVIKKSEKLWHIVNL